MREGGDGSGRDSEAGVGEDMKRKKKEERAEE